MKFSLIRICSHQCNQCLFSKNKIVSDERKEEIINKECLPKDKWFSCHKFTIKDEEVVCRGFWDKHKRDIWPLRLAQIYQHLIEFINPPKEV